MTLPEVVIWTVVAVVGLPAMWRNPTAAALVLAWLTGQAIYLATGNNLPVNYYLFPDVMVCAVIFAKPEYCSQQPYRSTWHQLKCVLLERSPADRIVLLIFVLMWALYPSTLNDYNKWWSLFGLVIAQFLAAGVEALNDWRSRPMPGGKSKSGCGFPIDGDGLIKVEIPTKIFCYAAIANAGSPAMVFLIPRNATLSRLVGTAQLLILHICRSVAVTQVFYSIVRRVTVDVVDAFRRPAAIMHRPCNSVGVGSVAVDLDFAVAKGPVQGRCLLLGAARVPSTPVAVGIKETPRTLSPKQLTRLRLIAKKLTEGFRGRYFSNSHCEDTFRSGQGRASASTLSRPAFSSINPPVFQSCNADAAAPQLCSRIGMEAGVG